jgi:hypothetical protein
MSSCSTVGRSQFGGRRRRTPPVPHDKTAQVPHKNAGMYVSRLGLISQCREALGQAGAGPAGHGARPAVRRLGQGARAERALAAGRPPPTRTSRSPGRTWPRSTRSRERAERRPLPGDRTGHRAVRPLPAQAGTWTRSTTVVIKSVVHGALARRVHQLRHRVRGGRRDPGRRPGWVRRGMLREASGERRRHCWPARHLGDGPAGPAGQQEQGRCGAAARAVGVPAGLAGGGEAGGLRARTGEPASSRTRCRCCAGRSPSA